MSTTANEIYTKGKKERCSHRIYGHFALTVNLYFFFKSQTLSYKPNPVSCEKISQTFVSNTEKITWLIGEEYSTFRSTNCFKFGFQGQKMAWGKKKFCKE